MDNRQTKLELVQNKVVMGIDIAKDKHRAVNRFPDGSLSKPFAIYADGTGHELFWQELPSRLRTYSLDTLVVGMEPTGHYWKSLAPFLTQKGITVVLVNPTHNNKYKELDDNSSLKSDKKDARVIADIVASGKFLRMALKDGPFAKLRHLNADRDHVIDEIRRAKSTVVVCCINCFRNGQMYLKIHGQWHRGN
jgi:transposase